MKTLIKPLLLLSLLPLVSACEDVIDIEVPQGEARLVIEASIDWEKGTIGNEQTIKLSLSTPYFEQGNHPVTGASVRVVNRDTEQEFVFQDQGDGRYTTDIFAPLLDNTYTLEVTHEGESYTAEETLLSVVPFDDLFQSTENGFDEDVLELNVLFTDPAGEPNFYLLWYQSNLDNYPYLSELSDEFIDGNQAHFFYEKYDDDDEGERAFQPGDEVQVKLFGISERYHDYMQLMISQMDAGNPFSAIPATLRGNVVNQTRPENYPLGYFRVTEVSVGHYVFQEQ